MNFEFIDNNGTIDRALRKQIRSHVAKGRNAGKKVNRPSRRNLQRPSKTITTETQSTRIQTVLTQPQTRPSTSSLPLVTLPWYPGHWEHDANAAKGSVPLILRAISFFSEMRHPRELDSALDYVTESHTIWVQPMFVDEAYFHGAMAVFMAAFPNLLAPTVSSVDKDSLTARVRHNCLALRMINSRLSGRDAFTDETLIVVLVLGLYERYQGEYHRGLVHLNGVQRILELRGGLRSLVKTRPDLARKIFRADVEYSLTLGTPTRFTPDDAAQMARQNHSCITITNIALSEFNPPFLATPAAQTFDAHNRSLRFPAHTPALAAVLRDATHIARLLQAASTSGSGCAKLASSAVHDTFILLGFRLQALSPLVARPSLAASFTAGTLAMPCKEGGSLEERAASVGLVAFVASFLWGGGCGRLTSGPLRWVEEAARDVITSCLPLSRNGMDDESVALGELLLWMLFVGVSSGVFEVRYASGGWVAVKTGEVMRSLGLVDADWESVTSVLERFPWIDALHGRKGRVHWERSKVLF